MRENVQLYFVIFGGIILIAFLIFHNRAENVKIRENYMNMAVKKEKIGDYEAAINDYKTALKHTFYFTQKKKIVQRIVELYEDLGQSKEKLGDYEGAKKFYYKAASQGFGETKLVEKLIKIAQTQEKLKNWEGAKQTFMQVVDLGYDGAKLVDLYQEMGQTQENLENGKGAEQNYTQAVELGHEIAESYFTNNQVQLGCDMLTRVLWILPQVSENKENVLSKENYDLYKKHCSRGPSRSSEVDINERNFRNEPVETVKEPTFLEVYSAGHVIGTNLAKKHGYYKGDIYIENECTLFVTKALHDKPTSYLGNAFIVGCQDGYKEFFGK